MTGDTPPEAAPQPEEEPPRIPVVATLSRLVDTYMYVSDSLDAHALHQGELAARHIAGVTGLAETHGLLAMPIPELARAAEEHFARLVIENAEAKAAAFAAWLRNQGLVALCTVLDTFLEALVEAILQTRVEILYASAGAKNVELKDIVELGSLDAVIAEFRHKTVRKFAYADIDERFAWLNSRCGLRTEETFRFERFMAEARAELADWDLDRLVDVYRDRHNIVHRNERPVETLEQLRQTYDAFTKIALDLTAQATETHGLLSDLTLPLEQLQAAKHSFDGALRRLPGSVRAMSSAAWASAKREPSDKPCRVYAPARGCLFVITEFRSPRAAAPQWRMGRCRAFRAIFRRELRQRDPKVSRATRTHLDEQGLAPARTRPV